MDIITRMEELSMNAWPTLQTVLYDGWILRIGNGYTKRSNSVNPIYTSSRAVIEKVAYCEQIYLDNKLPPVFKMTSAAMPNDLDNTLARLGYVDTDYTGVHLARLLDMPTPSLTTVRLTDHPSNTWFEAFCAFSGTDQQTKANMQSLLAHLVPTACFMSVYDAGEIVALGLGVLEQEFLGIFDVMVHPKRRRLGYGEQLMLNLCAWGRERGATQAYLQVVSNNEPALRLYAKLGFAEAYQYWYRVKR